MNFPVLKSCFRKTILLIAFLTCAHFSWSQKADSLQVVRHFGGAVSVTHNGISFIPTFSLGKPAVIFDLSMGKKRLSFEPQLRFALEGKPWSFLFWWRYSLVDNKRLTVKLGAHPALNFKTSSLTVDGVSRDMIVARRYLAGEIAPNFHVTKNISVGTYYLFSRGIDEGTVRSTNFVTVNAGFSHIPLFRSCFMKFIPQVYYLKQDRHDGFYATSTLTLAKKGCPFSLSAIFNKTIRTDIPGSKDFVWNATLVYAFHKNYVVH